ncbi:MAG: hypothetical protein ACE5PM_08725 [Candidatus Hydrothermarchaeales archaeon]
MKKEDHWKAYLEYKDNLFYWVMEVRGIEKSQRTIGLNVSRGIVELLSYFLHEKKLVDEGFQLNHRWFKSSKVSEKLPDFGNKNAIVEKMMELENLSEKLIYGAPKTLEKIKRALELFRDLEETIVGMIDEKE